MMYSTVLSLETYTSGICSNTLFCRSTSSSVRLWMSTYLKTSRTSHLWQSYTTTFEESQKNSKVLSSGLYTYLSYLLWSTWNLSWFWIFNVHLEQEKRIPLSKLCPARHLINFKDICKNFGIQKWVSSYHHYWWFNGCKDKRI